MKFKSLSIVLSSIILLALAAKPAAAVTNYVETLNGTFTGNGGGLSNIPPSAVSGIVTQNFSGFQTNGGGHWSTNGYWLSNGDSWSTNGLVTSSNLTVLGSGSNYIAGPTTFGSSTPIKFSNGVYLYTAGSGLSCSSYYLAVSPTFGYWGNTTENSISTAGSVGPSRISAVGGLVITTNLVVNGTSTATNGFASFSTNGPVNIAATGWTNTFAVNARVIFDGTAMTYSIVRANGTGLYTNPVAVAHASATLQPGNWLLISGTGVTGSAFGL